ncbi:MAG: DUF5680 domain-containing protein [bacterium]|nr:DUF5680 domain-containing protein [bacterium]
MDSKRLKAFLNDPDNKGYAGGKEKEWIKEPDASMTIVFEKGPWKSHDNFFGGEPYGGRTIVFYEGKPVWMLIYYGWVEEGADTDSVYGILRNALRQMPEEYPFRGPERYGEGDFVYTNAWKGEVDRFSGEEKITQDKKLIYRASYMGGWVDRRRGV